MKMSEKLIEYDAVLAASEHTEHQILASIAISLKRLAEFKKEELQIIKDKL